MRYVGQSHQLEISLGHVLTDNCVESAISNFHLIHRETYNHCDEQAPTEFVALRTVHKREPSPAEKNTKQGEQVEPCPTFRSVCLSADIGYEQVPVYQRATLISSTVIVGPAIIEQSDTTTMIYRNHRAHIDSLGNIIVDVPTPS
jgi:N-methylhydantoinase A